MVGAGAMRTPYTPGFRAIENRPPAPVRTRYTYPDREKTTVTPTAGASHATPSRQTGVTGPR